MNKKKAKNCVFHKYSTKRLNKREKTEINARTNTFKEPKPSNKRNRNETHRKKKTKYRQIFPQSLIIKSVFIVHLMSHVFNAGIFFLSFSEIEK